MDVFVRLKVVYTRDREKSGEGYKMGKRKQREGIAGCGGYNVHV